MKHCAVFLSLLSLISSSWCLFDSGECGRDKTCFVEEDFSRQFSFDQPATGDFLTIEMQAKNSKWVATSFSTDEFLGDDDVISCECEYAVEAPNNCSRIIAKDLRLNGRSNYIANHIDASQSLCLLEAEYVNGEIYCKLEKFIEGLFIRLFVCMFIYLFVRLFIRLFVYLFIYLFVYLFVRLFICLFIYLFICLFIYLFIYLFICLFIYLFIYLFVCLSIYLFVCLSIYLFIYLFVYLFVYLLLFTHSSPVYS